MTSSFWSRRSCAPPHAIAQFRKTVQLAPDFALAKATFAEMLARAGQNAEAVKVADEVMSLAGPKSRHVLGSVGYVYAMAGKRERALEVARRFDQDARAFDAAKLYIALGDTARAFRIMERSVAINDPTVVSLNGYPGFDPIRNTEHYRRIRQSMGLH